VSLIPGVTQRLSSPTPADRLLGMKVGSLIAKATGQELAFDELEGYDFSELDAADRFDAHKRGEELPLPAPPPAPSPSPSPSPSPLPPPPDSDSSDSESDLAPAGPAPKYLRQSLSLLQTAETADNFAAKQEAGLRSLPILLRKSPPDAPLLADRLLGAVSNISNDSNMDGFGELRDAAAVALLVACPAEVAPNLVARIFDQMGIGDVLSGLGWIESAAFELSGARKSGEKRALREPGTVRKSTLLAAAKGGEGGSAAVEKAKTKRWGGRAEPVKSRRNLFAPHAPLFFEALAAAFYANRASPLFGGEAGARVVARVLTTLASFATCAGAGERSAIAANAWAVARDFRDAGDVAVRRAVLAVLYDVVPEMSVEHVAVLVQDGGGGGVVGWLEEQGKGGDEMSALMAEGVRGKLLEQVQQFTSATR
jgi:hypothetical protein